MIRKAVLRKASPTVLLISALIAVVIWLVGSFDRDPNVVCLLRSKFREVHSKVIEVQTRDFFVEMLWKHIDFRLIPFVVKVKFYLSNSLISERS